MMKALICNSPGEFIYSELRMPVCRENYTLLKIDLIGICGTDYHAFQGIQPYFNYPRILGHEIAAEIITTQEGSGFMPGEKVTVSPYLFCGHCIACRNGKTNCCVTMEVLGVHIDGGLVSYLSVPTSSLVNGRGLGVEKLVLVEPLAIGAHGVRRARVTKGEFVLVIGAGPIGLATMNFAGIAGGKVIAMDVNHDRLQFCREKLAVEHVINPLEDDVTAKLKSITDGDMPTVVIDCSGNLHAINNAFQYMAHGARFVLVGLQKGQITINHPEFHKREATLMSSRNALKEDFDHVISSIEKQLVNPADYITHIIEFESLKDNFISFTKAQNRVIKAVVKM